MTTIISIANFTIIIVTCRLIVNYMHKCYFQPLHSQDLIGDSPYCLLFNFYDVCLENLSLDLLIIPQLIFFFILIFCVLDTVVIHGS